MSTIALEDRYDDQIAGVLSCYDRVVITGTLPGVCYAGGMTGFLSAIGVRIFDYAAAATLRERVRERVATVATEAGVTIEYVAQSHIVAKVLNQRGDHPGLVHILSAMEACPSYWPWHDKQTGKTFLRPDTGKCLYHYLCFMDAELGLVYLRVPTLGTVPSAIPLQRSQLVGPSIDGGRDRVRCGRQFVRPHR